MQFESFSFLVSLALACLVYWGIPSRRGIWRKYLLFILSYIFYSLFDWRFSFFLFFITILSYGCGKKLIQLNDTHIKQRKFIVGSYLAVSVSTLFLFKYLSFFVTTIAPFLHHFTAAERLSSWHLLLPIGLSFYLFMSMSYVIDCYRRTIAKTPSLLNYAVYMSFFPHLVAGPIDRARLFVPQLEEKKHFQQDLFISGLRQMLYGFFKKLVIADNLALIVSQVWNTYPQQNTFVILLGAMAYSVQIYADFSGYSDIAIGIGRLFGIEMMRNFSFPYFARTVAEFWRSWHISLTSWFTEYLYIPLGGSRRGTFRTILNTLIVFTLCGLWHGANWTFMVWGFLCGALFIPILLDGGKSKQKWKQTPVAFTFNNIAHMFTLFLAITICWVFFRSASVTQACELLGYMFNNLTVNSSVSVVTMVMPPVFFMLLLSFIGIEWKGRNENHGLDFVQKKSRFFRWTVYTLMIFSIFFYIQTEGGQFIYQNF